MSDNMDMPHDQDVQPIKTNVKTVSVPKGKTVLFNVTEAGPPKKLNVLVYGVPGVGKTVFAATFPKPLFVDIDLGLMSVAHKKVAYFRPVNHADLRSTMTVEVLYNFETIVVDSLTELHSFFLQEILRNANRDQAQLQDWGMAGERIVQFIMQLRKLPQHVVLICEERADKDEETGQISLGPALPGQLFKNVGRYVDLFFHMKMAVKDGKKGRYLITEPVGMAQGKDRSWALDKMEEPDFKVLWTKIAARSDTNLRVG